MIAITKKTSTNKTTSSPNRKISYIVIHYTAGVTSKAGSAASTATYFATSDRDASADFIVDDATIVQYNPDPKNRYTWAVGGSRQNTKGGKLYGVAKNSNTVSIEICSNNSSGKMTSANDSRYYFTDTALKNALELTKHLMSSYGLDADHVIRHYDVTGKLCPGIIGWNAESGDESKWNAFKAQLSPTENKGNMTYVGKGIGEATARTDMTVRDKASTTGRSVGEVKKGQKVEVLEVTRDGWYKIVWPGAAEGYAFTSNAMNQYYEYVPKSPITRKVVSISPNDVLNVRCGAGISFKVIDKLGLGNKVQECATTKTILGATWKYIRIDRRKEGRGYVMGYVNASYLV